MRRHKKRQQPRMPHRKKRIQQQIQQHRQRHSHTDPPCRALRIMRLIHKQPIDFKRLLCPIYRKIAQFLLRQAFRRLNHRV